MIQLYDYYRSTASFRVRIVLNLKGLDYQVIPINLLKSEQLAHDYQTVNPQSVVPTLKHDNKIISQSLAIIEYLNEIYPEPPLFPDDSYQKSQILSFALTIIADMHPLNNLGVLQYLTKEMGLSEEQKTKWYHHWIAKGFTALEKKLNSSNHSSDFCFGNTPSLADVCLVPQMYNARRFSCDINPYPTLIKIDANCQKIPAFSKAWPNDAST